MTPIISYALFAFFARCAFATVFSTSYELCTTKYGIHPTTPVPTTTYSLALTLHPTLKTTVTPVITLTPVPTTATVTYTQSVTVSTTTTLPQSTSTVPTPAGFTYPSPVPSPPSPTSKKRAAVNVNRPQHRSYPPVLEVRGGSNPSGVSSCRRGPSGTPTYSPARYPTSVICAELIEVFSTSTIVSTASTISTVFVPQSTVGVPTTIATTITNTATVTPAAATYVHSLFLSLPPPFLSFHNTKILPAGANLLPTVCCLRSPKYPHSTLWPLLFWRELLPGYLSDDRGHP